MVTGPVGKRIAWKVQADLEGDLPEELKLCVPAIDGRARFEGATAWGVSSELAGALSRR